MSKKLIFVGEDAAEIIKVGLIHTSKALFTAQDDVRVFCYRGTGGVTGISVTITKKKDDEKVTSK